MLPTYYSGDRIWVNKLLMGARLYLSYDFESPELKSFRMPGLSKLNVGDIAVFNAPYGRDRECIEFRINYVYAKRCLGRPGDTIGIKDGFNYNTSIDHHIGSLPYQLQLRDSPDSLIPDYVLGAYPYSYGFNWTIKELGPLIVPYSGMKIQLDMYSTVLYAHCIEYETGYKPMLNAGRWYLGGKDIVDYTFKYNYYYFIGDNIFDSKDSRYFGFVPEDYIIGKVVRL